MPFAELLVSSHSGSSGRPLADPPLPALPGVVSWSWTTWKSMSLSPSVPQPMTPVPEMPGPKSSTATPRTQAQEMPNTGTGSNFTSSALMVDRELERLEQDLAAGTLGDGVARGARGQACVPLSCSGIARLRI